MNPKRTLLGLLVAGLLSTLAAGCGLGDDGPPVKPQQPDSGVPQPDASQSMQAPLLDPTAPTACSSPIAVKGSVPTLGGSMSGVSVIITGGDTGTGMSADIDSSGRFCAEVALKLSSVNVIEARTYDPTLGMSPPASLTVTHSTCGDDIPQNPQPTPKSVNVALGSEVKASQSAKQGNETFITDGDYKTFALWEGGTAWAAYNGWVLVKLDKLFVLDKIVVVWTDSKSTGTRYGEKYKVLVSSMSDPGDPDLNNGKWTVVADITSGDGGKDTHSLSSKPLSQYVALWLLHDGDNSVTNWKDQFALAEIEVWDVPKTTTTPPPTGSNVCNSTT